MFGALAQSAKLCNPSAALVGTVFTGARSVYAQSAGIANLQCRGCVYALIGHVEVMLFRVADVDDQ